MSSKSVVVFVRGVRVENVSCVLSGCWYWFHAGVRPKRLRVYCQNVRTCSTCGRFAGAHEDVLNVHTEVLLPLSFSLSLSHPFSLPFLPVPLALPLEFTKQPLSGNFSLFKK